MRTRRLRSFPVSALLLLGSLLVGAQAQEGPRFLEETASAGVQHRYVGGWEHYVGGGVAAFDCSGDAMPELLLAGGEAENRLYANVSEPGGSLRFEPLARPAVSLRGATGAYPLDVDGDGLVDLAVLRVGENVLLRGTGDCRFERANERWGFDGGDAWSTAFAAVWEPGLRLPTLAIGNYVDRAAPGAPWGTCHGNELHRPRVEGEAGDDPEGEVYGRPLPLEPGYCSLSMRFTDWDRDGTPDLWVSNDRQYYLGGADRAGREQLWRLAPGEAPYRYTDEDGWPKLQIWGMGIATADLTGDGRPEVYLTSMADQKLRVLEEGARGPSYRDAAYERGVTAHRPFAGGDTRPSTGWHAQFEDVDHDGLIDLFVAKGNVDAMPEFAANDPNDLLLGRPDGSFEEHAGSAGLLSFERGRGAQLVDLNGDGWLDLVVVNREDDARLWRHAGGAGRSLLLELRQDGPNRRAIGAWIEVVTAERTLLRERYVGGGHVSGQWGPLHVGVGAAESVEVRVRWPDGEREVWREVPTGLRVELVRGGNGPRVAPLAAPRPAGAR